jgi:hypothetical protein
LETLHPMTKTVLVSIALILGTSSFAASASPMHHQHLMMRKKHKVLANGRCDGISYGTGQRSCGTASGGTPGGNPSRN